ncbi:MAG: DUF547 domain-containing protein [Hyphomonadaceae bacterium]|nr:DUF547 domain-containing protein [Hyphomonadaceae bacterium]
MRDWNRRAAITALSGLSLSAGAPPALAQANPTADLSALLARYVSLHQDGVNRVAYARWRASTADMARLNAVIDALAAQRPSAMSRPVAFAYWANLYNAITLKVVLDRYPIDSIRDIRSEGVLFDPQALIGPWRARRVSVEGRRMSLDDIEHDTLRPLVRDPRVHYAVNCASIGCPNIQPRAWSADSLERDLDAAARAFVNHPRGARIVSSSLRVSSIYEWFKADFGGNDVGVIAHLRRFAEPALRDQLASVTRISGHDYDWALNGAR